MYFSINTAKIVFLSTSCLSLFLIIIFSILGKEKPILAFYIIKIIIDLVYLILTIISLTINIAYVKNFMYKINSDFEREKNESSWDIILIIYYLMKISLFIIIIYSPPDNRKDIKITQIIPRKKISEKNHIPQLSSQNSLSEDEKNKVLIIEELNKKIEKIEEEKTALKIEINTLNKENTNLKNKIDEKDNNLNRQKELVDILNKKLEKNELKFSDSIQKKDKEINWIKSNLPFEFNRGEKLLCVIFQSFSDQSVHFPLLCKDKQIFKSLENQFYEVFPKFKETENYFLVNAFCINRDKTLEENNIKNGSIIIINFINDLESKNN